MLMVPDFSDRRVLSLDELAQLDEPAVIFEHFHVDSDGQHAYVYTVAGFLDGVNVAVNQRGEFVGGAVVGGDVIVIHAPDRASADDMAGQGLMDTIDLHRAHLAQQAKGRELIVEAGFRRKATQH